ncbi:sigma-70 family RNA polymerase sigma factor [Mycobacterium hodleri]|uniref:RNA polymerase sigma factor n=2 Tax=Mycolicibacterium hodleri TaxID=49897 RepID=A0A544W5C1_9MYCO|nr:sigma-70 family RNA polymerase sigma factor [Mycolicibacterium hodleri]
MTALLPHDSSEAPSNSVKRVRAAPKVRYPVESGSALAERFVREAMPYRAALLCSARRLTHRDVDAEDLVQDTMMNAFLGFDGFQPGTNLRAWLYRIMHNRWISVYRMKQRRPDGFCVDAVSGTGIAAIASRSTRFSRSAEDEALSGLSDRRIEEALRSLPEGFQKVLYYVGVEGYTYADTAILLRIPVGTVISRLSRSRVRLRAQLADYTDGSGSRCTRRPSAQ